MAGDWIKVEHATRRKPEVLLSAEMLGISRREAVGLFLDYFLWLDEALPALFANRDAVVTHMSRKSFDMVLDCPGFAATLEAIGWAVFDDDAHTLTVINAGVHNGKAAKSRALARDRMQRSRSDSVTRTASPEKRREESKPTRESIPVPTPEHQEISRQLGINCAAEWVKYLDHQANAKGKFKHSDLEAGFRNWLKRAADYARPRHARSDAKAAVTAEIWKREPADEPDGHDITGQSQRVA